MTKQAGDVEESLRRIADEQYGQQKQAERLRQMMAEIASEITCSMDNGYGETLDMLHALNAAAAYIVCLRQVVYSNLPEVVSAARANLNRLGQDWTTHLIRHESRMRNAIAD